MYHLSFIGGEIHIRVHGFKLLHFEKGVLRRVSPTLELRLYKNALLCYQRLRSNLSTLVNIGINISSHSGVSSRVG